MAWYPALIGQGGGVELVTWADGTDEQISAMIDAYYSGDLTLEQIKEVWFEGDVRNIQLGDPNESVAIATFGTYNDNTWSVGESHRPQTIQVQILGFNHDTLSTASGSITKALMTVDLKNCLRDANVIDTDGTNNTEHGYMNSYNTNIDGWTSCARRKWCNGGFYKALPEYIRSRVKPVDKQTSAGNKSSNITTTSDYCFLLSEKEIFGTTTYSYAEGTQYSLYSKALTNRYKMPRWDSSNVSDRWWERSPFGSNSRNFCIVDSNGSANFNNASSAVGLAPAFCL